MLRVNQHSSAAQFDKSGEEVGEEERESPISQKEGEMAQKPLRISNQNRGSYIFFFGNFQLKLTNGLLTCYSEVDKPFADFSSKNLETVKI